jgi:hypothetical protein
MAKKGGCLRIPCPIKRERLTFKGSHSLVAWISEQKNFTGKNRKSWFRYIHMVSDSIASTIYGKRYSNPFWITPASIRAKRYVSTWIGFHIFTCFFLQRIHQFWERGNIIIYITTYLSTIPSFFILTTSEELGEFLVVLYCYYFSRHSYIGMRNLI